MEYTKNYYSIKEVAQEFKVKESNIRYWESQFEQLSPKRSSTGIRKYTPQNIEIIKEIHYLLKIQKMSIEGAKKALKENPNKTNNKKDLILQLTDIRTFLENLKDEISK